MQTRNKMQTADSYWRHRQITLFWLSVDTPFSCAKSKLLSTVSLAGIRPIPIVLGNCCATFGVWSNFLRF